MTADRDLAELAQVLGLPAPPSRIEGLDISNISGTFKVASLVSFRNGRPDRANYRKFKIKSVEGQDDFASMAEVVRRRYSRLLREATVRTASTAQLAQAGPAACVGFGGQAGLAASAAGFDPDRWRQGTAWRGLC